VILGNSEAYSAFKARVEMDGFAVIPECLDETTVELLRGQFDDTRDPERNLLSVASVRDLAASKRVRRIMEAILGPKCFAVRGIFFNKTRSSNWKVVWHQDLTISVRQRADANGFGPWTSKAGIVHVQPPADVMSGILAIRLHLDKSAIENGPLRVLPGSHRHGRLTAEQIGNLNKEDAITCIVPEGGAVVMRPLVLHASSSCAVPNSRRVIHLEFAATELPHGLNWHDRVSSEDRSSNQ
jgi:ectoine hydroxylase-related dioxygenase (phytanoyl-CoA dioxygenase family)